MNVSFGNTSQKLSTIFFRLKEVKTHEELAYE